MKNYVVKEKKVSRYITDDAEVLLTSNILMKKIQITKILMKKIIVKNKYRFLENNFENVLFEGETLEMYFLREKY